MNVKSKEIPKDVMDVLDKALHIGREHSESVEIIELLGKELAKAKYYNLAFSLQTKYTEIASYPPKGLRFFIFQEMIKDGLVLEAIDLFNKETNIEPLERAEALARFSLFVSDKKIANKWIEESLSVKDDSTYVGGFVDVMLRIAQMFVKNNKFDTARKFCLKANDFLSSKQAELVDEGRKQILKQEICDIFVMIGDIDRAIDISDNQFLFDSTSKKGIMWLVEKGKYKDAQKIVNKNESLKNFFNTQCRTFFLESHDFEKAKKFTNKSSQIAKIERLQYLYQGKFEKAFASLSTTDPFYNFSLLNLKKDAAMVLAKKGEIDSAIEMAKSAYEINLNDEEKKMDAPELFWFLLYMELVFNYLEKGKISGAEKFLEKALILDVKNCSGPTILEFAKKLEGKGKEIEHFYIMYIEGIMKKCQKEDRPDVLKEVLLTFMMYAGVERAKKLCTPKERKNIFVENYLEYLVFMKEYDTALALKDGTKYFDNLIIEKVVVGMLRTALA